MIEYDIVELTTWLRKQLSARERTICPHLGECQRFMHSAEENWLLDDIAAKRRLLECLPMMHPVTAETVAKLLALPEAGQSGYREEWAP